MTGRHALGIPDWTDAASYAPLLGAERSAFAWEWLRRQDAYRGAALAPAAESSAGDWGLAAFVDPCLAVPDARPVWRADADPWVLAAEALASAADPDSFDRKQLEDFVHVVVDGHVEQLLLSDGRHSVRLDLTGARSAVGPVRLTFSLSGLMSLSGPLATLARLRSLATSRRFTAAHFPAARRARRLIQILRAADGIAAGASQVDLAEVLLVLPEGRRNWRLTSSSIRSQAQRLVRAALQMSGTAYRGLLR